MSQRAGFSLFEIVMAMAVFAITVLVLGRFSTTLSSLDKLINQELQVNQDTSQALSVIITDIRSLGPSSLGAYAIESAATNSLVFYSDIDRDGLMERVRYFFATSTLNKGVAKPSGSPLAYTTSSEIITTTIPNVITGSSTFDYYDALATSTFTPLASPYIVSAIRIIRLTVTADVATSSAPRPVSYTATITVRNLRSN